MYYGWSTLKRLIWLRRALTGGGGGGTETTITGVSPLLLEAAIKSKMKSLVQSGVVEQDGTPTPSSPVDLVCNNGAVKMIDDELPLGYKRVLGITYNNNVYYQITGFKMRGSDTLRFSFKCTQSSPACNIIGAYDGSSAQTNFSLYVGNTSAAKYLRYNGSTYNSQIDSNVQYNAAITPTGSSGMKTGSSWTAKSFESGIDLCIGTTSPTATSAKMVGDILGNVIVDGRLKAIPCERESDGKLGYYDTYSAAFYEPIGDGAVSLGYDGSHLERVTDGTPEVISIAHDLVDHDECKYGFFIRAGNASEENPRGSESPTSGWCCSGYVPVEPETNYKTVVAEWASATGAGMCYYADMTVESCISGVTNQRQGGEVYEFTTPENCHYIRFSWKTKNVEDGSLYLLSETPQTATAPDLFAVGDYADTVDIISGGVVRRCGVKVFDGTESGWTKSTTYSLDFYSDTAITGRNTSVRAAFCSHLVNTNTASDLNNAGYMFLGVSSQRINISVPAETASTVNDFKSWLAAEYAAGTPVIVIYPLAEEVTEQTTPQSIQLAAGDNVITVTAEVEDIPLEVTYLIATA